MSSKIYFNQNQSRGVLWWLTRTLTSSLLLLPNKQRVKLANKLLLKPVRRNSGKLPAAMKLDRLSTRDGEVQLYSLGQGPAIVLSHGWSGAASQLFVLMERIAALGYQAIAYDQLAHGRSSGDIANLFLFIKTQRRVLAHIQQTQPIAGLVCHSMAGTAAMNVLDNKTPMLLIAPVFDFAASLFGKVEESGVHKRLLVDVLSALESQHQMLISEIDPRLHIGECGNAIHIVHDQEDQFAPFGDSEMASNSHGHISLKKTSGLGHGRIINSAETLEMFNIMMTNQSTATERCG